MIPYRIFSRLVVAMIVTAPIGTTAAAQTIAITGGKVYPVSGPPIENGTVIITNGNVCWVGVYSQVKPRVKCQAGRYASISKHRYIS